MARTRKAAGRQNIKHVPVPIKPKPPPSTSTKVQETQVIKKEEKTEENQSPSKVVLVASEEEHVADSKLLRQPKLYFLKNITKERKPAAAAYHPKGSELEEDERHKLKAFYMFVKAYVDDNLDRTIPISNQPKNKISAIIDACGRQFPEYIDRARKRIRTYLKFCRGKKQKQVKNTQELPSIPFTPLQAKQILAKACENEAKYATRKIGAGFELCSQPCSSSVPKSDTKPSNLKLEAKRAYPSGTSNSNLFKLRKPKDIANMEDSLPSSALDENNQKNDSVNQKMDIDDGASSSTLVIDSNPAFENDQEDKGKEVVIDSSIKKVAGSQVPPTILGLDILSNAAAAVASGSLDRTVLIPGRMIPNQTRREPFDLSMNKPSSSSSSSKSTLLIPPAAPRRLNESQLNIARHLSLSYRQSADFLLKSANDLETLVMNHLQ